MAERAADLLWDELEPWIDPQGCQTSDARCFVYDDGLRTVVGHGAGIRLGGGQRPPLPLRLLPRRRGRAGRLPARDARRHWLRCSTCSRPTSPPAPRVTPCRCSACSIRIAATPGPRGRPRSRTATTRSPAPKPSRHGTGWRCGLAPAARRIWPNAPTGCCRPRHRPPGRCGSSPTSTTCRPAYDHGIVSLTWGGKRDYATWFSPEPSAILGIQILPVGPISLDYLAGSPDRVGGQRRRGGRSSGVLRSSRRLRADVLGARRRRARSRLRRRPLRTSTTKISTTATRGRRCSPGSRPCGSHRTRSRRRRSAASARRMAGCLRSATWSHPAGWEPTSAGCSRRRGRAISATASPCRRRRCSSRR